MTSPPASPPRSALRIIVTGSSGLVGKHLCRHLTETGHNVERLVRHFPRKGEQQIGWDPARGWIDQASLEGADVVIHLAGENIAAGRWTRTRRQAILDSRVQSTRLLCENLAGLDHPPSVLICASAIGYYGATEAAVNETAPCGRGFLAAVCQQWESATETARNANIRVVHFRLGMVLSGAGGALARMVTPFKCGLGGVVGNGRQYISWIALDDVARCIDHAIENDVLSGPVNIVAPEAVTNRQFVQTLGRVLRRPTIVPMPAVMVRLLFGEMGVSLLLNSCHVVPGKLKESGFRFSYPDLLSALQHELVLDEASQ